MTNPVGEANVQEELLIAAARRLLSGHMREAQRFRWCRSVNHRDLNGGIKSKNT